MEWPVVCVIIMEALELLSSKPLGLLKRFQVAVLKNQQQRTVKPVYSSVS